MFRIIRLLPLSHPPLTVSGSCLSVFTEATLACTPVILVHQQFPVFFLIHNFTSASDIPIRALFSFKIYIYSKISIRVLFFSKIYIYFHFMCLSVFPT